MKIINPYLLFQGTCEEAFNFYKSVFGGEFTFMGRFGDMPPQEGKTVSDEQKNKIMHVSLPVSRDGVLMGSDTGDSPMPNVVGTNISLSITVDSQETADNYFSSLSAGGKTGMPMAKMFWGDYFGMCTDKYGVNWMISYNDQFKFPE